VVQQARKPPAEPQDRSGEIFGKLGSKFLYPETRDDLLKAMAQDSTTFSRKENGWAMSAPQETIDKLLEKVRLMKIKDKETNREQLTREREEREWKRKKEQWEEARLRAEAEAKKKEEQLQLAQTIAVAVAAAVSEDRKKRY
jgi:hypothetical protein